MVSTNLRPGHIINHVHDLISQEKNLLTAIIPITMMAGRLRNLELCLSGCANLPIALILIHDIQDSATSSELKQILLDHKELDIKLIEGEYGSPGLARNAGLQEPLAPWVVFWDSDDLPKPRTVLDALKGAGYEPELIIGDFCTNSSNTIRVIRHSGKLLNVAMNPGLWRIIIRSDIISELTFCSTRMGEDQLFILDLIPESRNTLFSHEIFYEYFLGDPLQLTSIQRDINEVGDSLILAKTKFSQNSKLRTKFSKFILIKLLFTTIARTKRQTRIQIIAKNLSVLLRTNPMILINFLFHFSSRQGLQK